MTTYKVTNIDGKIKEFLNDNDFINYTKEVYLENDNDNCEDLIFIPENISNAIEYINEYCNDLTLEIN